MPLSIFGFRAMWSPAFIGTLIFILIIYFLITIKWRKDFKNSTPLTFIQAASFISALVVLYIIKGSPLNLLSHIMFTMHMVQMAVLLLLIPALLIKGIPQYLWTFVLNIPYIRGVFRFMTKPVVALITFGALFSFYHIPIIFDFVKLEETLHGAVTFLLFLSGLFLYWPLLNNVEGQPKMRGLHKVAYLLANAMLITPACAMIIFAQTPFYSTYVDGEIWMKAMRLCVPADTLAGLTSISGPELFTNMSPLNDQQLGGVLMKVLQEIIFGIILTRVFYEWYHSERENADVMTQNAILERQRLRENEFRN